MKTDEILYELFWQGEEKAADELSRAQLELDAVNQRDTFELEE